MRGRPTAAMRSLAADAITNRSGAFNRGSLHMAFRGDMVGRGTAREAR